MDVLLDTVRDEIAACLETSYDHISLKDAQRRLNLKSEKEVTAFGKKVCFPHEPVTTEWPIDRSHYRTLLTKLKSFVSL